MLHKHFAVNSSFTAYWVKFFKGAGFPQDVATKHAVVFSNNRIKPDMLPDLDKPSLKEMGITLMGDMIAILRYAKKVVEETTCEKFLVDSEDIPIAPKIAGIKPAVKKVVKDIGNKTVVKPLSLVTSKTESTKKIVKPLSTTKKVIALKKPITAPNVINPECIKHKQQISIKRKLISDESYENKDEDNWNVLEKKKAKVTNDSEDGGLEYTRITIPNTSNVRTQQLLKKSVEQKRTVFDRLGDSSVTSTTNLTDASPTFNVTGIGKDVFKRSTSVFKRLGDIDDKKDNTGTVGILKNGTNSGHTVTGSPGILKRQTSGTRTTIVTTKRIVPKTSGTMHADHEASSKKILLNNTSRILKLEKKITPEITKSSERIKTAAGKLGTYRVSRVR